MALSGVRSSRSAAHPVMLAGVPVPDDVTAMLAGMVRAAGAGDLADRLDRALAVDVKLLALTIDERAIILDRLDEWRKREGLG